MPAVRTRALALTLAGALGAAALTGVALAGAAKPPVKRSVTATGSALKFSKKALKAPAGRVQVTLLNKSDLSHDIALKGRKLASPVKGKRVGKGRASKVTLTLKPGAYTYYCTVFGHESGGMKGTLTVTS